MTKQIELSGKTCLLVEVFENMKPQITIGCDETEWDLCHNNNGHNEFFCGLPKGDWRILGSGKADQLGQIELDDIMPKVYFALGQAHTYKNYGEGDIAWTSVESLASLLSYNGFKVNETVILVKE